MNSTSPPLKQKSINSLRTFNNLAWSIVVYKVEKSKYETEVAFPLPLCLLTASIRGWLFKAAQKQLTPENCEDWFL